MKSRKLKTLARVATLVMLSQLLYSQSTVYSPNKQFSFTEYLSTAVITSLNDTIYHPHDRLPKINNLGHLYYKNKAGTAYLSAPWVEEAIFIEFNKYGKPDQMMIIEKETFSYFYFPDNYEEKGFKIKNNNRFILLWK